MDSVWSSLSARLKREAAEDTSSLDEEDCDGLFVDIGVGIAGLEEELDSLLSDEFVAVGVGVEYAAASRFLAACRSNIALFHSGMSSSVCEV